jgi:hypothetical protein
VDLKKESGDECAAAEPLYEDWPGILPAENTTLPTRSAAAAGNIVACTRIWLRARSEFRAEWPFLSLMNSDLPMQREVRETLGPSVGGLGTPKAKTRPRKGACETLSNYGRRVIQPACCGALNQTRTH